jgi:hypothetical protein
MVKTRGEQDAKEPLIYRARFDEHGQPHEPTVIYDLYPGLPISEAPADQFPQPHHETGDSAALPDPGESIDDPLVLEENHTGVITVEVG